MAPTIRAREGQGGSSSSSSSSSSSKKPGTIPSRNEKGAQITVSSSNADREQEKLKNLGSGLASFFGDFFAASEPMEFSASLSDLPQQDPTPKQDQTTGMRFVEGGLLYGEWRRKEKEYLSEYLTFRLHPHPQKDGAGSSSESSSENEDDNDDEGPIATSQQLPESQVFGMETQEPFAAPKSFKKKRKQCIPFVETCLHDLTKLEFLDLNARTLTMSLSKIHKVWRLRDTKRRPNGPKTIRKPVFATNATSAPRLRTPKLFLEEIEEDGPVATIYKRVIHLEVEQLHLEPPKGGQLRNLKGFPRRIKVFFYNSYATAVSEWIREQEQQQQKRSGTKRKHSDSSYTSVAATDIVMSLSKIPAACIFPYALDPRNWREQQELVDYCLCIGDESAAISSGEHQIRFDSNEMEIRLMAVLAKTNTSEARTDAGSIITNKSVEEVDRSSELVLSRSTLSNQFLCSSSEITPKEDIPNPRDERSANPLETSWEMYQRRNRGHKNSSASNPRSASVPNGRPPLRQLNQKGLEQPQDGSCTKPMQPKIPRDCENQVLDVEPMVIKGEIQRRADAKDVNYVQLEEITNMVEQSITAGKGCNFKVNLYASVVAVTPPRITKRGDWMIAATLLDESCSTPMTINIFSKTQEQLPQLIWMGDVIRIHRAAVEKWYNKIQLQGLKPTQYVVIRKIEGIWQVIPTATNYFTFNRSDEERSQSLWNWANKHLEKSPSMKPEHCFTLEEMQFLKNDDDESTFQHKDITVMVFQKLGYQSSDVLPHGLLRVWDGTGNSPSDPVFMPEKLVDPPPEEQRQAAYPRAVQKVINTSQQLQASILGNMKIPISLSGRLSNVVIWEKSHWALIQKHIPVGTFLRLRNVHIPQRWEGNNFRSIFMHDKSWMTGLSTNNFEVRSLVYHHNECVRRYGSTCYNPEFGSAGACSTFVGNGLSEFCTEEESSKVYTGAVRIQVQEHEEESPTTKVIVADRSGSFPVVATPKIYHQLQTNSQLLRKEGSRFLVTLFRIVLDSGREGERQEFVLTNLASMDL